MPVVRLLYRSKLGYPGAKMLPALPAADIAAFAGALVYTFRRPAAGQPDRTLRNVSAITRLGVDAGIRRVVLHCLESDSPLAPLLMWDVAHACEVGAEIEVQESADMPCYFDRSYFQPALEKVMASGGRTLYRKTSPLDAESGDLDEWTFAIPAGPEDPTMLNACVGRILELDLPRKEILLCGRPAPGFRYWDQVRIVGEDITAPPVQICRKKNRLVEEASYENLCIIHDRVFLPLNFRQAVQRFGNAFPLTAMQSLYFDDRHNFAPRRYSDFGVGLRMDSHITHGIARGPGLEASRYATDVLPELEDTGFVFANAHRYTKNHYPTGSLYLVKKKVWQRAPQDERLLWAEFEDIEQGERAAGLGIPSRVNPHGVTQSLISRPILAWMGANLAERINGGERLHRATLESWTVIPRKPLLRKSEAQAIADGNRFMRKWGVRNDSTIEPIASAMSHHKRRVRWIRQVVAAVHLPLHRATLTEFLKDFEKLVMGDQVPYGWHSQTVDHFARSGEEGLTRFFAGLTELFNHVAQRPKRQIFARQPTDYFPAGWWSVLAGSALSALYLTRKQHHLTVMPGGYFARLRAILGTTPYLRYATQPVRPRGELLVAQRSLQDA